MKLLTSTCLAIIGCFSWNLSAQTAAINSQANRVVEISFQAEKSRSNPFLEIELDVVFTDPMEGSDGAIIRARAMNEAEPDLYFYADQYNNAGNWLSHYDTTAPEIIEQTDGRVTHFVAGLGTSGTFVGVGRRLREFKASIRLISVQPDSPLHGLEGLKHMGTAIVPGIYDPSLADEDIGVGTEEAFELTRELALGGLFVGISSGANLAGALRVARRASDAVIVVVFCDGGEKYLSERFWDESAEGDRRR